MSTEENFQCLRCGSKVAQRTITLGIVLGKLTECGKCKLSIFFGFGRTERFVNKVGLRKSASWDRVPDGCLYVAASEEV
jgi:transcription elongation factor Elf1